MSLTKTLFVTLILTGSFFIPCIQFEMFASGNKELCTVTSSSKVYLKGRLSTPTTRSIFQLIEVFQEDKSLIIYYLNALGEIEITISNDRNTIVYSEVISVLKKSESLIELNGLAKGSYTVEFKDLDGGILTGMFSIE